MFLKHKWYSLKNIVNSVLALVVTSYLEKFEGFKNMLLLLILSHVTKIMTKFGLRISRVYRALYKQINASGMLVFFFYWKAYWMLWHRFARSDPLGIRFDCFIDQNYFLYTIKILDLTFSILKYGILSF